MDDHQHQHHHHHHQPGMVHSTMESSESIRRCSMNMIFNTRPIGTCIVFRQFYVSGTTALISYLILLFLLAVGYEYLRLATSRFDKVTAIKLSLRPSPIGNGRRASPSSSSGVANRILSSPTNSIENLNDYNPKIKALGWGKVCVPRDIQLTRSLFYVTNVAISFFLMLVVMTYNAQIIAAVLAGAFVGHFLFHRELTFEDSDKGMACH
ncbi:Ctr copper transporter family-domain-containing protein [Phakopsora pachyrhizi]|uniref:Copper transport protein n=1 Tax=Phakopsora pachyrhizi TaxID=170000 RepID=A0AAV0BWE8_PHAPC|nr:Ctr copper transporter family-domain-containing protein [Phakopsora pachyrhizi]CAH7690835.1 Ctr copper transporter family-domain-containing protein [Phakopsora pachyrhizi]